MSDVGGHKLVEMECCRLPQQVAIGFIQVTEALVSARYLPVLYVGSQLVHGTNHILICKQTLAVKAAPEHLVTMVLNQNHEVGSAVGQWSVVSIEQII